MNIEQQDSICPLILVRCCGLDLDYLGRLTADGLCLVNFVDQQKEYLRLKNAVLDDLYSTIEAAPVEKKKKILQLKRDLFNERLDRIAKYEADILPSETRTRVSHVQEHKKATDNLLLASAHAFVTNSDDIIRECGQRFLDSDAAKALVLSSDEITKRWHGKWPVRTGEHHFSQHATTLLKYVSRSSTKPSPFSFFSPLLWGHLVDGCQLHDVTELGTSRSSAAVNLVYLRSCCRELKQTTEEAHWIWNPTLRFTSGYLEWHLQEKDAWHYRKVRAILAFESGLIDSLEKPTFIPQRIGALNLVLRAQAEQSGVIVRSLGTNTSNCAILARLTGNNGSTRACSCLEASDPTICSFQSGDRASRAADRNHLWKNFLVSVGVSPDKQKPGKIITEDVLSSAVVNVSRCDLSQITTSISLFCRETEEFAQCSALKRALLRAVLFWFPEHKVIPLVDLLVKVAVAVNDSPIEDNATPRLWQFLNAKFSDASPDLSERLHNVLPADRIKTDPLSIRINSCRESLSQKPQGILSATIQPARTRSKTYWVVGGLGQGAGRLIKRWLPLDPDKGGRFVDWVRETLSQYPGQDVAILDDVLFNTDTGLNIIPAVLSMPSRLSFLTEGIANIDVSQCDVVISESGEHANLIHRETAGAIFTHYDSVLSLTSRPISTQLLVLFGRPVWAFDFWAVFQHLDQHWLMNHTNAARGKIEFRPRIELEPNIVLRRASWRIAPAEFPKLVNSLSVSEVLRIITVWRLECDLPNQVFIRYGIRSNGGDGYKPQFIDFRSVVWVLFLARIIENLKDTLIVEEALPEVRREDSAGKRFTEEYAVHWRH